MPRVAIIAHDGKKADLVAFATYNRERSKRCHVVATSTTGTLLVEKVGLAVERLESGPHGGDVQIASRVVGGEVDAVPFIVDPVDKHPHDPDIQTFDADLQREKCGARDEHRNGRHLDLLRAALEGRRRRRGTRSIREA